MKTYFCFVRILLLYYKEKEKKAVERKVRHSDENENHESVRERALHQESRNIKQSSSSY